MRAFQADNLSSTHHDFDTLSIPGIYHSITTCYFLETTWSGEVPDFFGRHESSSMSCLGC